ncbi:tetratricopeptide repeat protein [Candidatus Marinimicrobia bacterium MT.SAG.3]|nr:tetratricopeptide repeat protein [Candidatus Marinimicrobia bacterium MT.SAG.3]
MSSEPKRKLAAIMFTDMVGYTALMQKDEDKARELIERHRAHMKPFVGKHGGEIIQYVGDGTFCRFDSAIEAVYSALEIQRVLEMEPEINLRIGIHVGDVVVKGEEVYGDGVNVASRLEPLAEPGGICVSHQVYENIKNQTGLSLTSLGKKDLKNVGEEMEVFAVTKSSESAPVTYDILKPALPANKSSMKWLGVAAVVTALVIVGLKIDFGTVEVESKEDINRLSIAVLPFENMSSDPENEFFADGITDAILTQLSKISDLKVIARTSVMQYKDVKPRISEIGKELGVANILEGSVQRAGNKVRIIAQLIDVETEEHLWVDTYDRELVDIFAIQSDVAKKIAAALKASLTPEEEKRINEKPTENMEAYDFYLRGNDYSTRSSDESNFKIGIQMYEKAVDLDPNFALAHSKLSIAHSDMYWFYYDRTEERLRRSKKAVDRALILNPNLPEAHVALGSYYYHGYLEYEKALKEFETAVDLGLNSAFLYLGIGAVQRRQGRMEEAIVNFKKAVELDPRSSIIAYNLAETFGLLRRYEEAERHLNKAISLRPDEMSNYFGKMYLYLQWDGDLQKARAVVAAAEQNAVSVRDPFYIVMIYYMSIYEKRFEDALSSLSKMDDRAIDNQFNYTHEYQMKAKMHGFLNNSGLEKTYYDSALTVYKNMIATDPDDNRLYSSLGLVYAGLNRKKDAIREGKKGVELLPISKEAWRGAYRLEDLAVIYAKVGEYDLAIDEIELLLSIPGDLSVNILRLDPKWDPLREHQRFIKLIAN